MSPGAARTDRPPGPEPARTGSGADALRRAVLDNLMYLQARYPQIATPHDWYMALAYSVRDRLLARWVSTVQTYAARDRGLAGEVRRHRRDDLHRKPCRRRVPEGPRAEDGR